MATLYHYPRQVLQPLEQRVVLRPRALVGPTSVSGETQAIELSGGGLWQVQCDSIRVRTRAQILAYRAVVARAIGPVRPIVVPIYDRVAPTICASRYSTHSDGAPFDDATRYRTGPVVAELAAEAALRATSLDIKVLEGDAPEAGALLTIDHGGDYGPRLYQIHTLDGALSADSWRVQVEPPLRRAAETGRPVAFDVLACTMQLVSDSAGLTQRGSRAQYESLSFQEAFLWGS